MHVVFSLTVGTEAYPTRLRPEYARCDHDGRGAWRVEVLTMAPRFRSCRPRAWACMGHVRGYTKCTCLVLCRGSCAYCVVAKSEQACGGRKWDIGPPGPHVADGKAYVCWVKFLWLRPLGTKYTLAWRLPVVNCNAVTTPAARVAPQGPADLMSMLLDGTTAR